MKGLKVDLLNLFFLIKPCLLWILGWLGPSLSSFSREPLVHSPFRQHLVLPNEFRFMIGLLYQYQGGSLQGKNFSELQKDGYWPVDIYMSNGSSSTVGDEVFGHCKGLTFEAPKGGSSSEHIVADTSVFLGGSSRSIHINRAA